jgi:hypothetical protein
VAVSLTLSRARLSMFTQAHDYWLRGLRWVGKASPAFLGQGVISGSSFLIGILLGPRLVPHQRGVQVARGSTSNGYVAV